RACAIKNSHTGGSVAATLLFAFGIAPVSGGRGELGHLSKARPRPNRSGAGPFRRARPSRRAIEGRGQRPADVKCRDEVSEPPFPRKRQADRRAFVSRGPWRAKKNCGRNRHFSGDSDEKCAGPRTLAGPGS